MGQADWSNLSGGLTDDNARIGVTSGMAAPPNGGAYVFGMRSVENIAGAVGKYCLQANFSPTVKGGRITGALRRATLGASNGFAPFLFFCANGSSVSAIAYILGLSDESASHIELRKGAIADGLPAVSTVVPAASPNVLMRSTDSFSPDTWQHLRLDVIAQGTGDVILQVYRNDLGAHGVDSPVWTAVPGMEGPYQPTFAGFVDDALGVNTGSLPIVGGYAGYGTRFETANRGAYFDHIAIDRQL